jgi:hypothetical protein
MIKVNIHEEYVYAERNTEGTGVSITAQWDK